MCSLNGYGASWWRRTLVVALGAVLILVVLSGPASAAEGQPSCTLSVRAIKISFPKAEPHHHAEAPSGSVTLTAMCTQAVSATISGSATAKPRNHGGARKTFRLKAVSLQLKAKHTAKTTIRLPTAALRAVTDGARESVGFTLTAENATGTATAHAAIARIHP